MVGALLRVDVTEMKVTIEPNQYEEPLQGRSLIGRIMKAEVDPECEPLGRNNKLLIVTGPFAGTAVPCAGRLSVGGKSPLTGGIKEANSGGVVATKLGRLGINAVVIQGYPLSPGPYLLYISGKESKLVARPDLKGKRVYELASDLAREFPSAGLVLIGPAGEALMTAAGIAVTDVDGIPGRYAARGGLGALMGSKGIKAIVVDDSGGKRREGVNRERLKAAIGRLATLIKETPQTAVVYHDYGTPAMVETMNGIGGLPTRNFSTGYFEKAHNISGDVLRERIIERGGQTTHRCMPGCTIGCSNVFPLAGGDKTVSPIEYETIGLLGSNCCIGDLDAIGRLNWLCNDLGIDTIEIGATIAVAMEAGLIEFGDSDGAARLIEEIGKQTLLGRVLGQGAVITGRVLGVRNVPAVKGQAMAAYEPRGVKGLGVTYATSPMGADHTAGTTARMNLVHHKAEGQVEASRQAQITAAVYDSLGMCLFVGTAVKSEWTVLTELLNGMFGIDWSVDDLREAAKGVLKRELEFNRAAGLGKASDRLPEYFYTVENPRTESVFDIPPEDLDRVLGEL